MLRRGDSDEAVRATMLRIIDELAGNESATDEAVAGESVDVKVEAV